MLECILIFCCFLVIYAYLLRLIVRLDYGFFVVVICDLHFLLVLLRIAGPPEGIRHEQNVLGNALLVNTLLCRVRTFIRILRHALLQRQLRICPDLSAGCFLTARWR